jgi:hypothetical protein
MTNLELFEITQLRSDHIEMEIFADEIRPQKNRGGETWAYIAILIVPVQKKEMLLERLLSPRGQIPCDSEIKCRDLDKSNKRKLAEKWIDVVLTDKTERSIFFDILGLNMSRLHLASFGADWFRNSYNRFFRSCVIHGIHCCFPKKKS